MAYKSYSWRCANIAAFWTAFQAFMLAAGWTLYDDWTANKKVYTSTGESGLQPTCYIYAENATSLYLRVYLYWDPVAHTGVVGTAAGNYVSAPSAAYQAAMAGDKNLIYIASRSESDAGNVYSMIVGQWPFNFDDVRTTTTAPITAGSSVSIPVVSSDNLGAGGYVQIAGIAGRDRLQIASIPDATHIVVASLPRNYASGSIIGRVTTTAGMFTTNTTAWYCVCRYDDVGVVVPGLYLSALQLLRGDAVNVMTSFRSLSPMYIYGTGFNVAYNKINGPLLGYGSVGDVFGAMNDRSIPPVAAVTSASGTSLVDSAKAWTADIHIGRWVIITNGLGVGQCRKINDNDATSLTVDAWQTNPDATSQYQIVDTAYRNTNLGAWKHDLFIAPA